MYATAKVAQLTDEQTFKRYRNEMGQLSAEVPNKWIRLQRSLQQDLAKYSKMAIDAGILERQTRLAESQAGMVVTLIENVMSELGLTNAQRKRLGPAIRKNMDTIEGEARELPVAV